MILFCFQLTGSVLDDEWKSRGQSDMDEIMQRIKTVVLDATCSRWVYSVLFSINCSALNGISKIYCMMGLTHGERQRRLSKLIAAV